MRLPLLLLAAALLGVGLQAAEQKPHNAPVQSMSPEQFQRELSQAKHYEFELAPNGLVDAQGTFIKAADLTAYLHEHHLDPGAYFLISITKSSPPLNTVAPLVDPIGRFGATKIVFRHKDGGEPIAITSEYKPAPGTPSDHPATNVIKIRPNARAIVAGQAWPDLSARPAELRPGSLPPRVRYKFGADDEMTKAAAALTAHLLEANAKGESLFASKVTVQYGAWQQLKHQEGLGKTGAQPFGTMMMGADRRPVRFEGALLTDGAELTTLEHTLAHLIAAGGGGHVHALTTEEMARWWPYVGFDYVEPIMALTTNDGAHTYVFLFEKGRVQLVDDLSGLPAKQRQTPAGNADRRE